MDFGALLNGGLSSLRANATAPGLNASAKTLPDGVSRLLQ